VLSGPVLLFGAGYSGRAFAAARPNAAIRIFGTTRRVENFDRLRSAGIEPVLFDGQALSDEAAGRLGEAEGIVVSTAPDDTGDPVLRAAVEAIRNRASRLKWIGYLSTIGVYGNHDGAWIDEATPVAPSSHRTRQRVTVERAWEALGAELGVPVSVLRLSGIYGPGRNALVNLAEGTARRLVKPGQVFNRIHAADIGGALWHLAGKGLGGVFNVTDDMPAPPQDVVEYAARLMGVEPPPEVPFVEAELSPMARSFYGENKRVSNAAIKRSGYDFRYPDYQAALGAMWADGSWRGEGARDARSPIRAS